MNPPFQRQPNPAYCAAMSETCDGLKTRCAMKAMDAMTQSWDECDVRWINLAMCDESV
jgi:hypothetical protein